MEQKNLLEKGERDIGMNKGEKQSERWIRPTYSTIAQSALKL